MFFVSLIRCSPAGSQLMNARWRLPSLAKKEMRLFGARDSHFCSMKTASFANSAAACTPPDADGAREKATDSGVRCTCERVRARGQAPARASVHVRVRVAGGAHHTRVGELFEHVDQPRELLRRADGGAELHTGRASRPARRESGEHTEKLARAEAGVARGVDADGRLGGGGRSELIPQR